MADISDVQNALVTLIAGALYPNGTSQPSAVTTPFKVYSGWPVAQQLDSDLAAGTGNVSVFSGRGEKNTTRFTADWQQQNPVVQTLTCTYAGQVITIGGTIASPFVAQNVMAMVNYKPYVYSVQPTDTLNSIAAGLAALIAASVIGTVSSGATITVPSNALITAARIGVLAPVISEIRRQARQIQISIWVNSPAARDAASALIDSTIAALRFITLSDNTSARIIYQATTVLDNLEKSNLFRRDLMYLVEYATTLTDKQMQITQQQLNVTPSIDGSTAPSPPITTYF